MATKLRESKASKKFNIRLKNHQYDQVQILADYFGMTRTTYIKSKIDEDYQKLTLGQL